MKYSFEHKLRAVKYHLETGSILYTKDMVTKRQKHTYSRLVYFWEAKYLAEGEKGLRHKESNDVYSPVRKLEIIEPILREEISATRQSKVIGIGEGTLCAWIKRYKLLGMDGLKCSKRGRPPKNMPNITNVKEVEEPEITDGSTAENIRSLLDQISQLKKDNAALKDRNKDLEHKDLLSRAEIDYLKKLHALAETKRQSGTSKKRKPSERSAKAKNTKES